MKMQIWMEKKGFEGKLKQTRNHNWKLKRKVETLKSLLPTTEEVTEHSIDVHDSPSNTSVASAILGSVSPS